MEPYNSSWPIKYNKEYHSLKSKLGKHILDIQHIGSTAIPSMKAKPIIDIMISVKSLDNAAPIHSILEELGYMYRPEMSSTERLFFRKGNPVEFHVSITEPDNTPYWNRQIMFRDFIIKYPEYIDEYEKVKMKAIEGLSKNELKDLSLSEKYNSGKDQFVEKILKLATSR
jgi:GrpB-like predicted nucleotidyltransferase (UPF0157 family)